MRGSGLAAALMLGVLATIPASAQDATRAAPDWMAGLWRGNDGRMQIEEYWTPPAGSEMLGINRTLAGGTLLAFEFLRIGADPDGDGLTYCARPGGGSEVCFRQAGESGAYLGFENPDHDFPQRIEYRRDGDTLTATISDIERTRTMDFVWQRAGD